MRRALLMSAALFGLMSGGAFAQGAAGMPPVRDGGDPNAPPGATYRGGAGSPFSPHASNITGTDTHSVIAPRLPDPATGANTPAALLSAAQRALNQGRTGAAQEALERAETRILSRTIDPSMADVPDQAAMARHISAARRALGNRDMATAKAEVAAAMSAPVPPRGPTVTTTYPQSPAYAPPGYAPAVGAPVVGAPAYVPPPGYAPSMGRAQDPGYVPPRGY